MALVNTAVTLALRGRRVIVVDFDIEAPGLDTFDLLRPHKEVPGIIDFVAEYMKQGKAPDVAEYIGECTNLGEDGKLWIMPSGRSDTYTATLEQIDWADLYERRDGYVLFEDLRAQWSRVFKPDYVLIDSRTGHSDSSGICTRQLPDSVVLLFFPNEQNLRGLTQVVDDIRNEENTPRRKKIHLHFVMSNVPDIDDEDLILKRKIDQFQKQLGFHSDPMIVHRYDSLSLLNQVVFSKDRPRSRLAQEYNHIAREIYTRNWNDRDGALEYIRRAGDLRRRRGDDSILERDERLARIEEVHREDGEVLYRLAELKESDRDPESAIQLIDQAIQSGYERPEAYLKRSRFHEENNELDGARADAWYALESEDIAPPMVREAVRRLARLEGRESPRFIESNAVSSLDVNGKFWLASTFNRSLDDLKIAVALQEQVVQSTDLPAYEYELARQQLGLSYMGLGRCSEAATIFHDVICDFPDPIIDAVFNFGMAVWGRDGTIDRAVFERVIQIDQASTGSRENANYLQCMAIAYWAAGEVNDALDHVHRAQRSLSARRGRPEFSCWRYLLVSMRNFLQDLDEIKALIENGEQRTPPFMAGNSATTESG